MKAYIQTDTKGNYYNVNAYIANEGFTNLGWETCKYVTAEEITEKNPENIVVGGIGSVRKALAHLGIQRAMIEIDYPPELTKYLGRRIWSSTIEEIFQQPENWNIFIKPQDEAKAFVGKVVKEYKDFIGLVHPERPTKIWCSEIVNFRTEWRCFIRYGEVWDIRQYKGAWDSTLDLNIIRQAIQDFVSAPAAYTLDFGIDENGKMMLVEINDGHSCGTYGMEPIRYAKFLSARWAQMTNTKDYLNF